jgi:hypothetical protein
MLIYRIGLFVRLRLVFKILFRSDIGEQIARKPVYFRFRRSGDEEAFQVAADLLEGFGTKGHPPGSWVS